jgi:hypothetical protein
MELNRREFLVGMTALTATALFGPSPAYAWDICDNVTLAPGYVRKKDPTQLSISFLGTFAIFVFKDHIEAYTPSIVDDNGNSMHNYWLATPLPPQGLKSQKLFDLNPPNELKGIGPQSLPNYPTFKSKSPNQPNNIDDQVSLVVNASIPQKYLHKILLPVPDDIVLAAWSQKGTNKVFENQSQDFCFIARDHRFLYNAGRFDKTKLTFNDSQVPAGLDFRFLSEPQDDNQVAQECEGSNHIERAMKALAQMLNKPDTEYRINVDYCNQQQLLTSSVTVSSNDSKHRRPGIAKLDGGGGPIAVSASRFPACQSAIINATGT